MPSKEPRTCLVCQRPGIVNLRQNLNGVHSICGQERKRLIRGGLVGTELMTREPQSNIEKHIVFLDMLQRGEVLRGELTRKARPKELKAILELCLNMKEGNLTIPTKNPHRTIVTTLTNRNISLSNKKKWMLECNKILFNIISPALKEWKKVQKDINRSEYYFLYSFDVAYKRRRTSKKGKRSKKNSAPLQYP